MNSIPTDIYSVDAVREIDRNAIESAGIAGYVLMQRAASAALDDAMAAFPSARRWQVLCGSGNNGGDGYVMARLAAAAGIDVSVISLADTTGLKGDAAVALADFTGGGGVVTGWAGDIDNDADLLIDALLGSGLQREVGGDYAQAVAAMNRHAAPVHALDIPTGIHGDSGAALGIAVHASLTTTFVGLKAGLFLADGPNCCGGLHFSDLAIPETCKTDIEPICVRIDAAHVSERLPQRRRTAHKGDFGHVLVIGGGPGMPGAARLCAEAALRAGAGRVSVATHPQHAALITAGCPELMSHAVDGPKALTALLAAADVVAVGPGLGQSRWARDLLQSVSGVDRPTVWDADALNLLSQSPDVAANRIITPHPGEAAGLLGQTTATVQADRLAAVQLLARQFGGIAVLKGAGTLVATAQATPRICTAGNPGMAAPGMGDALTGIIAAMAGQGLPLAEAASIGVFVHATAGDVAAMDGERGMLATDLIHAIRGVVNP